jgi:hypothetical protein
LNSYGGSGGGGGNGARNLTAGGNGANGYILITVSPYQ